MTQRTIKITSDDIAALLAMRPVLSDASAHPGRDAAIAALDRLAEVPCEPLCRCDACCRKLAEALDEAVRSIESTAPPPLSVPMSARATFRRADEHTCTSCGMALLYSARKRGNGMCGYCTNARAALREHGAEVDRRVLESAARAVEGMPVGRSPADPAAAELAVRSLREAVTRAESWNILEGLAVDRAVQTTSANERHPFRRGDGRLGPPDETCAVCQCDPRNEIHGGARRGSRTP